MQHGPPKITRDDWSLNRKGARDAARHMDKVKEAVKENLHRVIGDEAIITHKGDQKIKVPIRSLDLPRIRYDYGRNKQVGQGQGQGTGGKQAGDQPGEDVFEHAALVDLEDLAALLFEDLALPNLQRKQTDLTEVRTEKYDDVTRKGPMSNMDKRRTIKANISRNAAHGNPHVGGFTDEDLRFRAPRPVVVRQTNAVVIAMRDVSSSMGDFEKYITRSFYFWMLKFLRTKYERVEVRFITHHTEAKLVGEHDFFHLDTSGGTKVSSAYKLAMELVETEFDPAAWNIYPFHFSDGDNWGDNNAECLELIRRMLAVSSAVGYGEIRQGASHSTSTLMTTFAAVTDPRFIRVEIRDKKDVYPALRRFFAPSPTGDPGGR
jgi:hypothetical protein